MITYEIVRIRSFALLLYSESGRHSSYERAIHEFRCSLYSIMQVMPESSRARCKRHLTDTLSRPGHSGKVTSCIELVVARMKNALPATSFIDRPGYLRKTYENGTLTSSSLRALRLLVLVELVVVVAPVWIRNVS